MTQEEWRWEPEQTPPPAAPVTETTAPDEASAPAEPVAPAPVQTPPPVASPPPSPVYGYPYGYRPPQPPYAGQAYPPPYPMPVIPDYAEETDTTKPLWQAVMSPLLPAEWQQVRARKRPLSSWCYGLAVLLAVYLGSAALYYGGLFLLVHLALLSISWLGYYVHQQRQRRREQAAYAAYSQLEAAGREVTVYCDRIEAVGLRDTVTVPFAGAVLWESQGVLTVENHGAMVAVRSSELTAAEANALVVLLQIRIADRRGKKAFYSYRTAVEQRRPAPLCRPEEPLFDTRFTRSAGQVTRERLAGFLREQGVIWWPLVAMSALMFTDCWAKEENYLLYYVVTLLFVFVLSLLVQVVAVLWDARRTAPADTVTGLRFYRDRLVLTTGARVSAFPREMVRLYIDEETLMVHTPAEIWELPLKTAEDPAALREFLQG